jgi:ribosome-binding protein aMBF1 (putative translation factor)
MMPSRARTVGPEASERLAEIVRKARLASGLSMPRLSAMMHDRGYDMSPATINAVENGIALADHRRTRLVTVDELHAFIKTLGIPPQVIIDWLYNE